MHQRVLDADPMRARVRALSAAFVVVAGVCLPAAAGADDPLGEFLAARLAGSNGDLAAAADYYAMVVADDPDNLNLLATTSLYMLADGRVDEAVALSRRLFELEPANPTAGLLVALGAAARKDYAEAAKVLESVPAAGVNTLVVPLVRGWAALGDGRLDDGLAAMDALKDNISYEPFYMYQRALVLAAGGRPADAEETFTQSRASTTVPRQAEIFGNFLEQQDRFDESSAIYENLLDLQPGDISITAALERARAGTKAPAMVPDAAAGMAEVFIMVAEQMARENSLNTARNFSRMAVYVRPGLDSALLIIADSLEQEESWAKANEILAQLPESSAHSWDARLRMALNLNRLEDVDGATALLERMGNERRTETDALELLADIYRFHERYAEAVPVYDEVFKRIGTPEQRHWALLFNRGIVLERSDQWDRAEADFLQALEFVPGNPDVLNYLGYSWVELGRNLERATQMIEDAVRQRPTAGYIVDSLGWAQYRLGNYEEAVTQLERAVQLTPSEAVLHDHLGDAYWRIGRKREAVFQWQHALDLGIEEDIVPVVREKIAGGLND